jgi:hypothetical protein
MHVAVIGAALALSGCGGNDHGEIRAAIKGYLDAVAEGDGRRACTYLTENAQLGVFEFKFVHIAPDHPQEACAATVTRRAPTERASRLRGAAVNDIAVDGDRAEAKVDGHGVQLVRVDGAWKLNVFGVATDVARAWSS